MLDIQFYCSHLLNNIQLAICFIFQVVGLDLVDDESKPERRPTKHMPTPAQWTNVFNPAFSYYVYYCYANLYTLNKVCVILQKQSILNNVLHEDVYIQSMLLSFGIFFLDRCVLHVLKTILILVMVSLVTRKIFSWFLHSNVTI